MTAIERFIAAFKAIGSPQDLNDFVSIHGLTEDGFDQLSGRQVYRVVGGVIEGEPVKVTYRWHDPSQAFAVKPDIAKVDLEIKAVRVCTVEWPE